MSEPSFTVGIEEEYLLVDPETREVVDDPPPELLAGCVDLLGAQVSPEFLRCQVEVGTRVCPDIKAARRDLGRLRQVVNEQAEKFGYRLLASATHPISDWQAQQHTDKERYNILAMDMGVAIRRLMICGMHVHAAVGEDRMRMDLMNQVRYFLPHLLCLSTSSPFWQGYDTGLKSYRLAVFGDLPRSGLPEEFRSFEEYRHHVQALVDVGVIEDATKLWWDVRPSDRYPTLEMRICDICTYIEDGITIAAMYLCLLRMLFRLRGNNIQWRRYRKMLLNENRWRAQRYGFDEGLIDFGQREILPYADLLEEILDFIKEDAEALNCVAEVENARDIVARGTSAHHQVRVYQEALTGGADQREALYAVVDWLVDETMRGVPEAAES